MPATRPKLTAREVAQELDRINKSLGDRQISGAEYTRLLKERDSLTRQFNQISAENAALRGQRDSELAKRKVDPRPSDASNEANYRKEQEARRNQRGNINPESKTQPPKEVQVGTKRDPNANKPKGPQAPIPNPSKGQTPQGKQKGGIFVPVIAPVDSQNVNDATAAMIRSVTLGSEDFPKGTDPGIIYRVSTRITRDLLNGIVRGTGLASIVNAVAEETGLYKAKPVQQPNVLGGKTVSNEQIAALMQVISGQLLNHGADLSAITKMVQATASHQDSMMGVLSNMAVLVSPIASMAPAVASTHYVVKAIRDKVGAANFTLQNQAATLTKSKLGALDVAQVMKTTRLAEPKLQTLDAAQLMNTSRLTEKKLNILDATQLMTTSRLAEKKLNILDATQLMTTSRLAEKKWNILDATQLMTTSRLTEKKWNVIDATQLMTTSRTAEKKWSIIDATQLMKDTRQIPAIFQQLQKPLVFPAEIARKSDIAAIKFPSDLARKSDIANIKFPNVNPIVKVTSPAINLPAPIVNVPATDISGIVQAVNQNVNQTINQQTTNITNIVKNTAPGLTQVQLDRAVVTVNQNTVAYAQATIEGMNLEMARQTAQVKAAVGGVEAKTDALKADVSDVSTVLGVPQLKPGLSVKPDTDLKAIGVKTDNGNAPSIAQNIPQLMMLLSAVPYVRQGLHRLGGSFDTSVMNPQKGKTKITDAMGFHQWSFNQLEERMGMPSTHTIVTPGGQTQTKTFQSLEDALEENNANTIVALQDLEVVERYLFALTQDVQKLMQITLQTREDVDVLIDDSGCKTKEVKKSHPTHINLTNEAAGRSLTGIFKQGEVHYVARQWNDSADKNQKLERMGYDTQIAAMSNKFEFHKTNPELPLDKSRATGKPQNDEAWRTFVSTMEAPPEGYVTPGNPIPDIKEIKNGNPVEVPKPTNPLKKLGK
jgi:hypothetical protein